MTPDPFVVARILTPADDSLLVTMSQEPHLDEDLSTRKIHELQMLLAGERSRAEERKSQYESLKTEHLKLQNDFLALQSELKQVLSQTQLQLNQKDLLVNQKESEISELKKQLKNCDAEAIRSSITKQVEERIQHMEREKERLLHEDQQSKMQIEMMRQRITHLESESAATADRIRLSFESEINLLQKEKQELKMQLLQMSQGSEGSKFMMLQEENNQLLRKINSLKHTMEETEGKYVRIQKAIESLELEYDMSNEKHEMLISDMRSAYSDLKAEKETADSVARELKRRILELEHEVQTSEEAISRIRETAAKEVQKERDVMQQVETQLGDQLQLLRNQSKRMFFDLHMFFSSPDFNYDLRSDTDNSFLPFHTFLLSSFVCSLLLISVE